jgi:hypothetical protein
MCYTHSGPILYLFGNMTGNTSGAPEFVLGFSVIRVARL